MASNNSDSAQVPVLAGFQFDASGVTEGVNLFRGNLAFPLKLLTLPGRNSLTFDVTALYQSNVESAIESWNLTSPTDILGVGWSLPYDRIVVDPRLTGTRADDAYYLVSQGQTTPLVAIPDGWTRASVTLEAGFTLAPGPVAAPFVTALAGQGVRLSPQAHLEPGKTPGAWRLRDPQSELVLTLTPSAGGTFTVATGGQAFEVTDRPFWQAVYYADFERWEIVKDDGSVLTFGGAGKSIRPGQPPNVVSWGIRWDNWIGASIFTQPQSRYARAWNLASLENSVGNSIVFNYSVVEQSVGGGPLTYTKECHLLEASNDLGWTCSFAYLPLTYDFTSLVAPKEYLDPYRDPSLPPGNRPDAYQSSYNTQFLDRVTVTNQNGEPQLSLHFDYYPLQNLTSPDGPNALGYGATYKRFLKSIQQEFPTGVSLPPVAFEYLFTTDDGQNRGALAKITYPSGGTSQFSYQPISIGGAGDSDPGARNLKIANPFGGTAAPRIWYGADYVVCGWYSDSQKQLLLNIFTWLGRWYPWQSTWVPFDGVTDLTALQVATSGSGFLLAVPRSGTTDVYLFNRRHLAAGDWQMDAASPYSYASSALNVATGDDFFVVAAPAGPAVDRYAWSWMKRGWEIDSLASGGLLCQTTGSTYRYYLTAGLNYHLVHCYDTTRQLSRFNLYWRDPLDEWQLGGTLDASDIAIAELDGLSYFNFGPGGSFAALAWATAFKPAGDDVTFDYSVRVLTWDESFENLAFAQLPVVPETGFTNLPSPILRAVGPVFVDNALVGSGPNLFRWDGVQWTYQFLGVRYRNLGDPAAQYYWYAYAGAAAMVTENTSAGIYSALVSLDPSRPQDGWQTQVLTDIPGTVPQRETKAYPTLANDYLTQDASLYGRSVYPTWLGIANLLLANLSNLSIDTTTMINQGPFFAAFMTLAPDGSPNATSVLFFQNGDIVRTPQNFPYMETLDGQQMFRMLDKQHHYKTALSGKLPAIPLGFVTFPASESDDEASEITLHRYANQSVVGPIRTFVLSTLAVDDGYDRQVRCYDYQDISASQDATGTIVRFHQVAVYQGCLKPADQRYGSTLTYFFNGLPPEVTGMGGAASVDTYSALDGMMIRQEQWDTAKNLVSSLENTWAVADQIAINAQDTQFRNLYGGIPQVSRSSKMIDGVRRTTDYVYSPSSGAPNIVTTTFFDSLGNLVTRQQSVTPAYQKYAEMWNRNLLKAAAQTVTYVQRGTEPAVVTSVVVQTAKAWPRADGGTFWADSESWLPLTADAPPFTAWTGGDPGPQWKRSEQILSRARYGQVSESIDVQGRHLSLLYDDEARVVLGQFVNASFADGISYDGFEPYQQTSWAFNPPSGGAIFDADSFTGAACFAMTQTGTLAKTVQVGAVAGRYAFALWCKTPPGATGAGLSLTVSASGSRLSKPLAPTNGAWANAQWIVDLAELGVAGPAALTLGIEVTLGGAGLWARVDDIVFTPLLSQWSATVYDLDLLWTTASLGLNAACQRTLRNPYGGVAARTGVYDNPVGLATTFYSLQTASAFAPASPNLALGVAGREQGFLDEFKDGALGGYTFIDSTAADWQVADRQLALTRSVSEPPLGARVRRQGFAAASLAAYVLADAAPAGTVSLGTGVYFALWNGSQWQLVQLVNGQLQVLQSNTSVPFQQEWLLCVFDDRICFFANGIPIFNYQAAAVAAAPYGVELGLTQPGSFRTLVVAQTLGLTFNYSDGLARPIQSLAMESGASAILTATLYDDRGLEAITIKPSRVTTAQVANPFAFYSGYVTNAGFGSALWSGGAMSGPVSAVYHPDDGGYPFSRKVFEPAPTARVLQLGKPGADFAITASGNPHITTNVYGTNTDGGPFLAPLPAGQYLLVTTTDADGNTTQTWSDTEKNRIGVIVKGTGLPSAGWVTSMVFDPAGRPTASIPPSYHAGQDGGGAPGAIPPSATTASFNFLGQRTAMSNPDQGASRCVYDYASQARFMQDAAGAAQGFIRYVKYDALNRPVEDGSYPLAQWDEAFLQDKANNDPSWPPAETTWNTRRSYDGDDTTPYTVGRLWRALANNSGQAAADVTDSFAYDRLGNVVVKSRQLAAFTPGTGYRIECAYDPVGGLASSLDSVIGLSAAWTYNPLGQVVAISGTAGGATTTLLRLAYTQGGQIDRTDVLPTGGSQMAQRVYAYNPPDWRLGTNDPTFDEALRYTDGACGGGGYFGGSVAHQSVEYQQGGGAPVDDCFTVDALNQIVGAGSGPEARSWSMDANGNFQTVVLGTVTRNYTYAAPGSNQLQSVASSDGSLQRTYQYGPGGDVETVSDGGTTQQFAYSQLNGRVTVVTLPAASVAYAYDPSGERTLETTVEGGSSRQAFSFAGQGAILQLPSDNAAVRYLTAPGVVVAFTGGAYYFGLLDHLGSTRTILAATGAVVGTFEYDLYGAPTVALAPPFPYAFYYTGQTWNPLLRLYQFPTRFYDPAVGRYLMADPALQQPSPYVYVGNNPMLAVDPSGGIAWYWYLAAFTVGAIVTIATGGLGAVAFGTGIGAAMAVGAVAGILGTLASDAVLALGGEHITAERLLIDVLSAGAAGIAGAGVGGVLGQLTARATLNAGWSAGRIVVASSLVSGISGGIAGGAAGAGVTALMTGEPFFSKATALNMLLGTVTGAGAGLMAAGVHLGWLTGPGSLRTVPVELTPAEFGGIQSRTARQHFSQPGYEPLSAFDRRMLVLNPYQADSTMARLGLNQQSGVMQVINVMTDLTTVNYGGNNFAADTVAVHGVGRYVVVEWRATPVSPAVNRPLSAENLALFLGSRGFGTQKPIRLISCFGALPGRFGSTGQTLANAFQQDVYAHWKIVYPETEPTWWRFRPTFWSL